MLFRATLLLATAATAFAQGTQPLQIRVETSNPTPLAPGFSGLNQAQPRDGVEYFDPKFVAASIPMKAGWLRFPGGTVSLAYDWNPANPTGGHINPAWLNDLVGGDPPLITGQSVSILTVSEQLTQAKGGVYLSDFANFAKALNASAIMTFNSYTDTNPESATLMAQAAQSYGLNVLDWELSNEADLYPNIYPTAGTYASTVYNPYYLNIIGVSPGANVSLFSAGEFTGSTVNTSLWDSQLSSYTPRYWNASSLHIYPITEIVSAQTTIQTLNGILAHGSTDYINSYLVPLVGAGTPIYITEFNCCAQYGNKFLSYLYNGIFLAEYIMRLSSLPDVHAVGINSLYTDNSDYHGLLQSVNDFEGYLIGQVTANPNFSTNTATNPNTQFQFYVSAPGLAMQVANLAINSSANLWPTTVMGGLTVNIIGYDGQPIPSVYAQAYKASNGANYLLITNKAAEGQAATLVVNGVQLKGNVTMTYVGNPSAIAANTAQDQNNVQIQTKTSTNPIYLPAYSVTCVTL